MLVGTGRYEGSSQNPITSGGYRARIRQANDNTGLSFRYRFRTSFVSGDPSQISRPLYRILNRPSFFYSWNPLCSMLQAPLEETYFVELNFVLKLLNPLYGLIVQCILITRFIKLLQNQKSIFLVKEERKETHFCREVWGKGLLWKKWKKETRWIH